MESINPLDLAQLFLCSFVAYGCFCRLTMTDRSVDAILRHAIAIKLGAFMALGVSPWIWGAPATGITFAVAAAVSFFVASTAGVWPAILEALSDA